MEDDSSEVEKVDSRKAMKALAAVRMARDHAAACRHGPATALLMQALQEVPQLADELEAELTFSLQAYAEELTGTGQGSNALWLYSKAIPLLPCPRGLYTNLGALHYSLGEAGAAIVSFQKALELDPGYWPALESLENVKSLAVDRWHYRMLNHSARNEAYLRAIERAIRAATSSPGTSAAGVTVLDIGTGTGILAVMAARAGASHVYACEVNGVLCDVAREVVERNGVADRVTVINKSSGALEPGLDLPIGGVDVVVTELVDSGLLGERIIPVLADARARGLLAEGGRVIPEGARVYGAVLESDTIRRRSRFLAGDAVGITAAHVRLSVDEPYTCEDMSRLDHRLLTSPTAVLDVDFLEAGAILMAPPIQTSLLAAHVRHALLPLPVQLSGRADAIAVWFDLYLDGEREDRDVDAGIYFSSGAELKSGDVLTLGASPGRDSLHLTLNGEQGMASPVAADSKSGIDRAMNGSQVRFDSGSGSGGDACHFLLGEMDLARLNDEGFHRVQATAVAELLAARGIRTTPRPFPPCPASSIASSSCNEGPAAMLSKSSAASAVLSTRPPPPAYILDLCGAWGLAGLMVAQLETDGGRPATRVLALCSDGEEEAATAMNALARENGLGPDRYLATAQSLVELTFDREELGGKADHGTDQRKGGVASGSASGDGRCGISRGCRSKRDTTTCCGKSLGDCSCWPGPPQPCGYEAASTTNNRLDWSIVMASSIVEGSGLLRQGALGDLELCRRLFCNRGRRDDSRIRSSVGTSAGFVPGSIEVVCRGLQRASLLSEYRVLQVPASDGDTEKCCRCCRVDVTPVNAFGVRNFRELDLSAATVAATARSNVIPSAAPAQITKGQGNGGMCKDARDHVGGQRHSSSVNASEVADEGGDDEAEEEAFLTEAIVCYDIVLDDVRAGPDGCFPRRSSRLRVDRDGTLHAIAYWYRQRLAESEESSSPTGRGVMLDTGPDGAVRRGHDSTNGDKCTRGFSHFRQAAMLLDKPTVVMAGQWIDVSVFCTTSQGVVIQTLGVYRDGMDVV